MSPTWAERGDLILDADGHLWLRHKAGFHWLGPIEGLDPLDLTAARYRAYEELLDAWRDAFDPRAEQEAAWRLSCE